MGVVYQTRQAGLNRLVALNMILGGGHAGAAVLARFKTRARPQPGFSIPISSRATRSASMKADHSSRWSSVLVAVLTGSYMASLLP